GADDAAAERLPAAGEQGAGLDQVGEALLRDQTADGENYGGAVRGRPVGELLQVQAVVDPLHVSRQPAVRPAQVVQVEVADGDDAGRIAQLAAQVVGPHAVVEDVLGTGGKAVRYPREARCQPGDGAGIAGERRVQMAEVPAAHLDGQRQRLVDVP